MGNDIKNGEQTMQIGGEKNLFEFKYVIGRGGFGKKNRKCYAIKEMSKAKIIDRKSISNIIKEKQILEKIFHDFISNMYYTFQDRENLYLVMTYIPGGNLRYHLSINRKFTEPQTKFFVACILIALQYIHDHNIIHRDIKPENLLLDNRGYVYVTDFGIAKQYCTINYKDTSGTLSYMAPEVLKGENHSFSVDFYALGVIVFECMYCYRPYLAKTKNQMKETIMSHQVQIDVDALPQGWSSSAAHFVNRLLQRRACDRLGHASIRDVMYHEWLKDVEWDKVKKKNALAPYFPKKGDNFNAKYCRREDNCGCDTAERYNAYLNDEQYKDAFNDFGMNHIRLNNGDIVIRKGDNVHDEKNKCLRNKVSISEAETKLSNSTCNNNSGSVFPCVNDKNRMSFNRKNGDRCSGKNVHKMKIASKLSESKFNRNLSSSDVNNQSNVELPNVNKSLIINRSNQNKLLKKISNFYNTNKIRNDPKSTRSLSNQFKQVSTKKNSNHHQKQTVNSLILNKRLYPQSKIFLKTNKSSYNLNNSLNKISNN